MIDYILELSYELHINLSSIQRGIDKIIVHYQEEAKEWVFIKIDTWYETLELYRFNNEEMVIYECDFKSISNNYNNETLTFKSSARVKLAGKEEYDICLENNLSNENFRNLEYQLNTNDVTDIDIIYYRLYCIDNYVDRFFDLNITKMYRIDKIVVLDIVKLRNSTNIILAHDLNNNQIVTLPEHINGMTKKSEIGSVYLVKSEECIDLVAGTAESKISRVLKELENVNLMKYFNKYSDCKMYPYRDFNDIKEIEIRENKYFITRFSNSIVMKYKGKNGYKYQLKLGTQFFDLKNRPCDIYPEYEGKTYRGLALIEAIKLNNSIIRYSIIKLFSRIKTQDELNPKEKINSTNSTIEIQNSEEYEYYGDEDFYDVYDTGPDSISDIYEDFKENLDDESSYENDYDEYYDDEKYNELRFNSNADIRRSVLIDMGIPNIVSMGGIIRDDPIIISYLKENRQGMFYKINEISDIDFTSNYGKVDISNCDISQSSMERIYDLALIKRKKCLRWSWDW